MFLKYQENNWSMQAFLAQLPKGGWCWRQVHYLKFPSYLRDAEKQSMFFI